MLIQLAPTEILHHIFLYLPKASLLNCATVCQSWNRPAIQLFYENVELSEKTKNFWLHIVQQAPKEINVGVFVKKLTISLTFSTTLSQGDFLKVISYLPFIKTIDINSSGYKLHYLAYLSKRKTGCVTYLEDINTGDLFTDYQIQQYFLCAYSFRHSLKNLILRNPSTVYLIQGKSGRALSFLNRFSNLNHISIIEEVNSNANELSILMNAIQSCTLLTSFFYQNKCLLPHIQDDLQQSIINSKLCSLKSTKLKNVELNISNLTTFYIKNMVLLFPVYLNKLVINMTHIDYRDWILQQYTEQFGLFLGRVKHLKISISNDYRRRNMDYKLQSMQKSSKLWLFIQSIMGGRQLCCNMKFKLSKSRTKPDISIEKDKHNMHLTYNSENIMDLSTCLQEFSPMHSLFPIQQNQIVPTINSILVEVPLNEKDEFNCSICIEIIKFITLNYYSPKLIAIMFLKINSNYDHLIQLKSRQNNKYATFDEPAIILDYALFKHINLQAASFKQVLKLLPSFNTLKIIDCKLEYIRKENMYTLDITGIAHMNQLVLDIQFIYSTSQSSQIIFNVEMGDNSKMCFILHTCTNQIIHVLNPIFFDSSSIILIKCRKIEKITFIDTEETRVLGTLILDSITNPI